MALCAALSCGCATKRQLPPIRSGSPIALVVAMSPQTADSDLVRDRLTRLRQSHDRLDELRTNLTEPPTQKPYENVGPLSSLAVWLDERNDFAQASLRSASQQIAAQIVSEPAVN